MEPISSTSSNADSVLAFGKHKGASFGAAYKDRRYVDWVLSKAPVAAGPFLEFREFSRRMREGESASQAPRKRKADDMDSSVSGAPREPEGFDVEGHLASVLRDVKKAAPAHLWNQMSSLMRQVQDARTFQEEDAIKNRNAIASALFAPRDTR